MHANYHTFHEMSVSWKAGRPLGYVNLPRVARLPASVYAPYDTSLTHDEANVGGQYLTLDRGYAVIVHLARKLFGMLPDNYLRALALQVTADLCCLIALYATLILWGWGPAIIGGVLYATNSVLCYVVTLTFYYFWDGVIATSLFILLLISYRLLSHERFRWWGRLAFAGLGAVLGMGVWLRASWFHYGVLVLVTLAFIPVTRRNLWIAALAFILLVAPQVRYASSQEGHFALSTRMMWHTAHQALGRYPNAFGLEDDDGYQFELAERVYGVKYNYLSYRAQDEAMREDYKKLFHEDPWLVVRSIATRIYCNITHNANENEVRFWNTGLLCWAIVGAAWLFTRGGERRAVALVASFLYLGACAAVGIVYYINPNYANVTQLCLILLVCGAVDGIVYLLVRLYRSAESALTRRRGGALSDGDYRIWARPRPGLSACIRLVWCRRYRLGFAVGGLGIVVWAFASEPLRTFVGEPRRKNTISGVLPLDAVDTDRIINTWRKLPSAQAEQFVQFAKAVFPGHAIGDRPSQESLVRRFASDQLKVLRVWNRQNLQSTVVVHSAVASDAQDALRRCIHFILDLNVGELDGFDLTDRTKWSGRTLSLKLGQPTEMDLKRQLKLVEEKLVRRGFSLASTRGLDLRFQHP
jgi:hypothetical protein